MHIKSNPSDSIRLQLGLRESGACKSHPLATKTASKSINQTPRLCNFFISLKKVDCTSKNYVLFFCLRQIERSRYSASSVGRAHRKCWGWVICLNASGPPTSSRILSSLSLSVEESDGPAWVDDDETSIDEPLLSATRRLRARFFHCSLPSTLLLLGCRATFNFVINRSPPFQQNTHSRFNSQRALAVCIYI